MFINLTFGLFFENGGRLSENLLMSWIFMRPRVVLSYLNHCCLNMLTSEKERLYSWYSWESSKPLRMTATKRFMKMIPNNI